MRNITIRIIVIIAIALLIPSICNALEEDTVLNLDHYIITFPGKWNVQIKDNMNFSLDNGVNVTNGGSHVRGLQFSAAVEGSDDIESYYQDVIAGIEKTGLSDGKKGNRENLEIASNPGFLLETHWIIDDHILNVCSAAVIIDKSFLLLQYVDSSESTDITKEAALNIINSIEYIQPTCENVKIIINQGSKSIMVPQNETKEVKVQVDPIKLLEGKTYYYSLENKDVCSCAWKEQIDNTFFLNIKGKNVGSTRMKIGVEDIDDIYSYSVISVTPFDLSEKSKYSSSVFTFRDIPWGSSFPTARDTLGIKKNKWSSMDDELKVSVLDQMFWIFGGDIYNDKLGKYSWVSNPEGITVAGHELTSIWMYYAYDMDDNGLLVKDDEHTKLYYAFYDIKPRDIERDYKDLRTKLIDKYGNPIHEGSVDSLSMSDLHCDVWMGADSTIMALMKGTSIIDEPVIFLSYATLEGNIWLLDDYEAIIRSEYERKKTSVEGL